MNKSGKRTHTLKQLLERQEASKQESVDYKEIEKNLYPMNQLPSLFEIAEDLPLEKSNPEGSVRTFQFGNEVSFTSDNPPENLSAAIHTFGELITEQIQRAADLLEIDRTQLKAWIDLQIEVPTRTILVLLRTIQNLHLDPLNEQIGLTQYEDGAWQVIVTIEGCSKLLNAHPQFNGLVFQQSDTLVEGVPEWIECSIYRKDRIMPITVREYFKEVCNETEIWKKMPRRMLRHRALQQCVRLAVA